MGAALEESYAARWFSNGGPLGRRLEDRLAARIGGERAVGLVSSATAGLTAALLALDVRGRVVVPAFTFPATLHAIELAGCEPLLCDIDPATLELCPRAAAAALGAERCGAVLHVRAFGLCRELSGIEQVARAAGVPLVIDLAAAFGGREPSGRPVGHAGDVEVFSFHATKVFAIGEGGAVAAGTELLERIRHTGNFAIAGSDVTARGLNAKLSDIAAAIGHAMLDQLDQQVAARRSAAAELLLAASSLGARVPGAGAGMPPWQCIPLVLADAGARDGALASLAADGIEGRAYYCPGLHRATAWARQPARHLPGTDDVAARSFCMPIYADMSGDERRHFGASLTRALGRVQVSRDTLADAA